jgi:ATP-dependent helicase/DNAse subunit B
MALHLIQGPPNSGRAGLIRRGFAAALDRDPVLVVPTVDDVFAFERELCADRATLGGAAMTFRGLFGAVARTGDSPPPPELTPAQRLRAIALAIESRRDRLEQLRRSAGRRGFVLALEALFDELQGAGLEPGDLGAGAGTLEGSVYLADLADLFSAYHELCDSLGRTDAHGVARRAIARLHEDGGAWRRPVFLYGFDDLTRNQLDLVAALAARTEVTVALAFEPGNSALAARARLLEQLRAVGIETESNLEPDPGNTPNRLLFELERGFGAAEPRRNPPGDGLTLLRSAGERGEAEAIGAEVARLVAGGADPGQIAIALRDPARRGPRLAATLESYGLATALEAELPVTATAVGGTLVALLSAELGNGRIGDLLRFLRGPSGVRAKRIDWFERAARRRRVRSAAAGLALWEERDERLPGDVERIRRAAADGPVALSRATARLALTMGSRPLRSGEDGPPLGQGDGLELRAAAAIANALEELAALTALTPAAAELAATVAGLRLHAWSGPIEGRVRIASPYRLRAGRFDHVFVGSLQDGEFPRRERTGDPFLSERQREALGLEPRRDVDAEERYLFHACLALPRKRLYLSCRDSDEDGAAEARSPFLDDVRGLLDPPPPGDGEPDPVEAAIARERDLTRVVHRVGEAPSEDELARAVAAHGHGADAGALLDAAGAPNPLAARVGARIEAARSAAEASRAPGPLREPAVLERLRSVPAYGGTTLEGFDLCSYRWLVSHELDPQQLDPAPDPLVQGGLMHGVLERLFDAHPGGDPLPRPASLPAWRERGRELLAEVVAERGLGRHPAELAMTRRVEALLDRFLAEEAARDPGGFEPWLLEARFGEEEGSERPALELDGWRLHGAIDRVDRDAAGRAVVIDYKLAGSVTPRQKLEEEAKLQLQLYLIAVAEQWGVEPVAGLYHPLRGSSERRPRGVVLADAAPELGAYGLSRTDLVDEDDFEGVLDEARERAGEIVARMRRGEIRRDPGPRAGLRGHGACPPFCDFAPICRRDRAPVAPDEDSEREDR